MRPLPIDPLLPQIVASLREGSRLVLRAPPGAGKTTRVPAALLDAGLARGRNVIVLEPRRIAARAAAQYVARERGEVPGESVGHQVRFDQCGGPKTLLWFVTEGILMRRLQSDPYLENTGIVVLDEFHERHLPGDVALAVAKQLQETVRSDLKIVVMSATLETEKLAQYLGGCPVLSSEGRAHAVTVEYRDGTERRLDAEVAAAVDRLLHGDSDRGDVLVFLPGAAEIRRAAHALEPFAARNDFDVVPLHGDLPLDQQQRVIQRGPRRKVVLSTNVAETALTIEGVTAVVDSGLARISRFDAKHGINALHTAAISRAAADQRTGRAGRTAPGRCLRLWSRAQHAHRLEREIPEVLRLDLSATVLELCAWGERNLDDFDWLDPPPAAAIRKAQESLRLLGALDEAGAVTPTGLQMLALPAAPRLARIMIEAENRGCPQTGALLAALASERDICRSARSFAGDAGGRWPDGASDLLLRLRLFEDAARLSFAGDACAALDLDRGTLRTVERARRQLSRLARGPERDETSEETVLRCILAGFPDRVVRRREGDSSRGVMVGGKGVALAPSSVVRREPFFVAVEIEAGGRQRQAEARVRIASAIHPQWLGELFPESVRTTSEIVFDEERERVVRRQTTRYADLVLSERTDMGVNAPAAEPLLAAAARRHPRRAAAVAAREELLLARIAFLRRWMPELGWPGDDEEDLLAQAVTSLCAGRRSFAELRRAGVEEALRGLLSWQQLRILDEEAPERYALPSGRSARVAYEADKPPFAAARIQEVFGLAKTPRLARGRVPLVLHLLAPNQRPAQITDDLESFWRNTYPGIRKLLRGRYPKHDWPEDPFGAIPKRGSR